MGRHRSVAFLVLLAATRLCPPVAAVHGHGGSSGSRLPSPDRSQPRDHDGSTGRQSERKTKQTRSGRSEPNRAAGKANKSRDAVTDGIRSEPETAPNRLAVVDGDRQNASRRTTTTTTAAAAAAAAATAKQSNVSSNVSSTVRRIRREFRDVVDMGIGYDWVKGDLVRRNGRSEQQGSLVLGPLSTNLRHWHFSFRGIGIYKGVYHGRIILPPDYPANPPRVQMWTPSGRFKPGADICLSASSYHPETWTPRWTVLSLVHSLRLHMLTNPQEIGAIVCNADEITNYANQSLTWSTTFKPKAKSGRVMSVTVDHAKMVQQGAIVLNNDSDSGDEIEARQDTQHQNKQDHNIPNKDSGNSNSPNPQTTHTDTETRVETNVEAQNEHADTRSQPATGASKSKIRTTTITAVKTTGNKPAFVHRIQSKEITTVPTASAVSATDTTAIINVQKVASTAQSLQRLGVIKPAMLMLSKLAADPLRKLLFSVAALACILAIS